MSDMGTLRTIVLIANPLRRGETKAMPDKLVDTGVASFRKPPSSAASIGYAASAKFR